MTRAEKVAEAQRLRAQGLYIREIAERMGVARATVDTWLNDPDLSRQRARREGYRGTCEDCGAPTDGSNGRAKAPRQCAGCQLEQLITANIERGLEHRAIIERLWAEGKTSREIAKAVGWNPKWGKQLVTVCRNRGYDLPHRYSPERRARMTAKSDESLAKARAAVAANRKAAA